MENENGDDGAAAVGPFALSSSVVETSAEGAAEGLASIQRGLELEGLGEVRERRRRGQWGLLLSV